jgi:hypothetical protein
MAEVKQTPAVLLLAIRAILFSRAPKLLATSSDATRHSCGVAEFSTTL